MEKSGSPTHHRKPASHKKCRIDLKNVDEGERLAEAIDLQLPAKHPALREQLHRSGNPKINVNQPIIKQVQLLRITSRLIEWQPIQNKPIQEIQLDKA